jgi:hypothetical protein
VKNLPDFVKVDSYVAVERVWGSDVHGRVACIIRAGEAPPAPEVLAPFFEVQRRSDALVKEHVPTRPSKVDRVLVERRPGRVVVVRVEPGVRFIAISGALEPDRLT